MGAAQRQGLQLARFSVAVEDPVEVHLVTDGPDGEGMLEGRTCLSASAGRRTPPVLGWSGPG
jgi:hypothetical protein